MKEKTSLIKRPAHRAEKGRPHRPKRFSQPHHHAGLQKAPLFFAWASRPAQTASVVVGSWVAVSLVAAGLLLFISFTGSSEQQGIVLSEVVETVATPCNDGTTDGQCVVARTGNQSDKPWVCRNGLLEEDSTTCGCPSGLTVWGDGTCTLRSHIKLFQQFMPYCSWTNPSDSNYTTWCREDLELSALRYDITGVFTHEKQLLRSINPYIRFFAYRNYSAFTASEANTGWPNYCATNGCTAENGFVHFTEDSPRSGRGFSICVPGFNVSNNPNDGQSCVTTASDHFARATTIQQSRITDFWDPIWMMSNLQQSSVFNYNTSSLRTVISDGGVQSDYIFFDIASFTPSPSLDLMVSDVYAGIPLDGNHPRIQETFDFQNNLRSNTSAYFGRNIPMIQNAITPPTHFLNNYIRNGFDAGGGIRYFESWDSFDSGDTLPSGGLPRAHYYELDFRNSKRILAMSLDGVQNIPGDTTFVDSAQAFRFVLSGINNNTSELNRAKMYFLSYFYLLNNKNFSFAFRDDSGVFLPDNSVRISDCCWVEASNYNVGASAPIPAGKIDVLGQPAITATTQAYVFAEGVDPSTPNSVVTASCASTQKQYHIIARQYTNAFVLTKFKEYCGRLGSTSETTHTLPGTYRRLNVDGTIDPTIITSITLKNNEGAILIPYDGTAPNAVTDLEAN